jgi:soluble lytic murein transglycosylase
MPFFFPSGRRRWIGLALLFILLDVAVAVWWRYQWRERSQDGVILAASLRYGVDPALIKAVVWRESRFRPSARGGAGELGLMQIRDEAALEWAGAERVEGFRVEHLLDAGTNTLAGTWYLRRLLTRYLRTDNPIPYALADYNAGRSHVLRWMQGDGATNSQVFLRQMNFPGTRRYIEAVSERHAHYRVTFRGPRAWGSALQRPNPSPPASTPPPGGPAQRK